MITLPLEFEFTAEEAASTAVQAREERQIQNGRGGILLGYLNQIRAALELGETSLVTTCMHHETQWLATELRQRGFEVESSTQLLHGQLEISWHSRA